MAIKIEMLRCFAAVARSGNLADAAERLGRTPSAVSMMLKQFEEHLGKPLFESERKNNLTALGKFALGEALREIDHFERSIRAIESFARGESGTLRVAAVTSVAVAVMPDAVSRFAAACPGVDFHLHDMDSPGILRELERQRVDLGIGTVIGNRTGIEGTPLLSDQFGIVCRHDHPLAGIAEPLDWAALDGHRLIVNSICKGVACPAFRQIRDAATLTVHNTSSVLAMVRAGVGITVLPELVMRGQGAGLRFLPVADQDAQRRIDLLRLSRSSPMPTERIFGGILRSVIAELPPDPDGRTEGLT